MPSHAPAVNRAIGRNSLVTHIASTLGECGIQGLCYGCKRNFLLRPKAAKLPRRFTALSTSRNKLMVPTEEN
jgi:hypothetical protein